MFLQEGPWNKKKKNGLFGQAGKVKSSLIKNKIYMAYLDIIGHLFIGKL